MDEEADAMTPFRIAWASLREEGDAGRWARRLDARLPLYTTIAKPSGVAGLELRASEPLQPDLEFRSSEQFSIGISTAAPGTLTIETRTGEAVDIFLRIADDLVSLALNQPDEARAAAAIVRRFSTWQRFLRETKSGILSEQKRLGLYGELSTLRDLLVPTVGAPAAVEAWTGPDHAPQDFQLPGLAIEVKSIVHSEPQTLRIDGERQLDDFGLDVLALAHHRVFVHQGSGETLPMIVGALRTELEATSSIALDDFDTKLLAYGYAEDERTRPVYDCSGYSLKETKYCRVHGASFPRLTESDLLPGMGSVAYSVTAAVCEPYAVSSEDLRSWLLAPEAAVDPATTPESRQVEYKETAWTPVGPVHEKADLSQIKKEVQNSVIKTVVAFMNGRGGELVIGVRDQDRVVTGVEVDLESRGRDRSDLDFYELELVRLLTDHIDALVHRQVRISFSAHETGTACHLAVAASPNPRFGTPFPQPNQKARPVFWVRTANATVELEGSTMVDYISAQWH